MLPAQRKKPHLTFEEVQTLFERWRKEKKGRDPIPPVLWEAAVSLTNEHTVNRVAKHLRLNHTELKSRSATRRPRAGNVAFIELDPVTATNECTVEMERPTGEWMKIKGSCTISELVREFFR